MVAPTWGRLGRESTITTGRLALRRVVVGGFGMKFSRQTTLRSRATVTGVGVHSGSPVSLTLGPASVDAGFIFVRTGLDGCDREVQATAESVTSTKFETVLGDRDAPCA